MTQLSLEGFTATIPADPVLEKNPYKTDIPSKPEAFKRPEPTKIETSRIEAPKKAEVAAPVPTPASKLKVEMAPDNKKQFRKGRPRSEKSRGAILRATNSLLNHTSVQELSIEAIAKKARVGKTTIYRWWPNKTAVIMEALASQPSMQEALPDAKNNTEALVMQLEKLIRLLHSKNGATIAQLFSEAQGDDKAQEIFESSFLAPLLDAIEYSIEQGKTDGEFRASLDTKMAIDLLCGPIFFRLMSHPADFNEDFEKRFPKQIVKVISV